MEDKKFHDKVDKLFESKLKEHTIRVKDLENDKILNENDMNYDKVLFDTNLNIYKIIDGTIIPVDNPNFKALLI